MTSEPGSEAQAAGPESLTHLWTIATGAAIVAGAWWLRSPRLPYLAAAVIATVVAAAAVAGLVRRDRRWAGSAVGASLLFCVLALLAHQTLGRIDDDWPAYRASLVAHGAQALDGELSSTARSLRESAERALDAPVQVASAFDALSGGVRGHPERALVLYRRGVPAAWAGRTHTATDSLVSPLGVVYSPFYVTMYVAVVRGESRAVATATVHALPPGDRLAPAMANRVARDVGLHSFTVSPRDTLAIDAGTVAFAPAGDTLLVARAVALGPEEARLLALERVRTTGAVAIVLALALFLVAAWRQERSIRWRLAPLAVGLVAAALVPLSTFSSRSVLFDPTVYYSEIGGPLTGSIAALGIAAAFVLLGLLLMLRSRDRIYSRAAALAVVLVLGVGGPLLIRALASGVMPPPGGVSDQLWLAWEVALFLSAASLLAVIATAGHAALGLPGRGLPPALSPALAAIAALLGPVVLGAPGAWPVWYTLLWVAAIASLALARPHRRIVLTAAAVAALGATTLTWNAGVRGRAALANRDVAGLGDVPSDVMAVLQRFAAPIAAGRPRTSEELVRLYVESDLMGSGYPVALRHWNSDGTAGASVMLAPIEMPAKQVAEVAGEARRSGSRVLRSVLGMPGTLMVLAVPHAGGAVTTVVVGPRTRLIPDDPFNSLLGLGERESGPPPYTISILNVDPAWPLTPGVTRWFRSGRELHGNRLVQTVRGPMRAHMEIDLRPQAILVQRGTLVVLLDLLVLAALWTLSALPEASFRASARERARRWARSYRARLTLVLFGFFVLPALAFALWSYQRLQSEDRQSRELLVRETLRSYEGAREEDDAESLASAGARLATPLLIYRFGELRDASDPLFESLAPGGRFLPPAVYQDLRLGREAYASERVRVGGSVALFGFLSTSTPWSDRLIVAAPARGSEYLLDQRRRDLGVLVLFATVLGALGALWLSRVASMSLARPIGNLRSAALAIARGEHEPPLEGKAPEEFEPVFSAFRRMTADLGESRTALESAQRRTTAVLRHVASGVVALSHDGMVMLFNPRAEALLGRPLGEVAIVDVSPLIAERVVAFLALGSTEEEFELELGGRQLQARLARLTGGGEGVVLTLDDVTELARAQRVIAWGEMARQVAHEIKNPLTPIRLGVQHLQRTYADARPDFGDILTRNAERILAEINRLDEIARNFSRYGTAPAERRPPGTIDVAAVARDVVELERLGGAGEAGGAGRHPVAGSEWSAGATGDGGASDGAAGVVTWRLMGADEPITAIARRDELREVLLNVLENARLAGASVVELHCTRREGRVVIDVHDDGSGIPAQLLPRLFEPHFSTRTSGSGLGLAMSRQLVEGWGGAIAIASTEGKGTRVRIELVE